MSIRWDDSDRLDVVNKLLREGSPYMRYYASAHEMPEGGWALYDGTRVLGWGREQRDAIDHAINNAAEKTQNEERNDG